MAILSIEVVLGVIAIKNGEQSRQIINIAVLIRKHRLVGLSMSAAVPHPIPTLAAASRRQRWSDVGFFHFDKIPLLAGRKTLGDNREIKAG